MAVQPLRMTPRIPLCGWNCRKPCTAASTDSAAPRAFMTSTVGLAVFCAVSQVLARMVVRPRPS